MRPAVLLSFAAVLALTTRASFAVDLPARNGDAIMGTLEAGTVSEIFRIVCPAGAALTVRAKAKNRSPRSGPIVRLVVIGPGNRIVADGDGRTVSVKADALPESGEYRVVVSSKNRVSGDFALSISWTGRTAYGSNVTVPSGGTIDVPFAGEAGTVATLSVRPASGSTTTAALVSLGEPDVPTIALGGNSVTRRLSASGDHVLTVAGTPGGSLDVSVRLRPVRVVRRRLRLDSAAVPKGRIVSTTGLAGPRKGGVIADPAGPLAGAALSIRAGSLAGPTGILIGPGIAIDPRDLSLNAAGPAVFFGPKGLSLEGGATARVTLPFDPGAFPHGTSGLRVFRRSARGVVSSVRGVKIDDVSHTVRFASRRLGEFQVFAPNGVTQVAKLIPADIAKFGGYGFPLAIDGDYAVRGAPEQSPRRGPLTSPVVQAGAAYVYHRSGGVWSQIQELALDGPQTQDLFGAFVAISGDTIAIGVPGYDVGATNAGAVFVYTRSGDTFQKQAELTVSNPQVDEILGYGLAIDGDTIVAGAPRNNRAGTYAGTAYVFSRRLGAWTQEAEIAPGDLVPYSSYPNDIAVSGDRVIAGAPHFPAMGVNNEPGVAYVWARSGGRWTLEQRLGHSSPMPYDDFGWSVAIDGSTAVVGARLRTDAHSQQGSACVFVHEDGRWTQQAELRAIEAHADQFFGESVALDGDTVLVGAPHRSNVGNFDKLWPGAAFLFTRTSGVWSQRARLAASDSEALDQIGFRVALSGTTSFVASFWAVVGGGHVAGAVYVFDFAP